MRKIKIFISLFLLYELFMLTVLQIKEYCLFVFNVNFCSYESFKYFFICIMLPVVFGLFIWWIPDISKLFCNKQCDCNIKKDVSIKDILNEIISKQDIERFVTAAIIMGIQKFANNHPETTKNLNNILDIIKRPDNKNN